MIRFLLLLTLLGDSNSLQNQHGSFFTDTIRDVQVLHNGRIWRDQYHRVDGDQFFLTTEFFPGSITIEETEFNGVPLRYDAYLDELNLRTPGGIILQVNKEMVSRFTLNIGGLAYPFVKKEGPGDLTGYYYALYEGATPILMKYRKAIELQAIDRKIDRFYEVKRLFLLIDGVPYRFSRKNDFLELFGEKEKEVSDFVKANKLVLKKSDPQGFVRAAAYFDSIKR